MPSPDDIKVSVVIPHYDRPQQLERCLDALAEQSLDRSRFEVVVADDGSPQPPWHLTAKYNHRIDVRVLPLAHGGPAAARNAGAEAARNAFIAFTDDDCMPSREWLATLAEAFAATPESMIGGRIDNALPDNLYSTASQELISFLYGYFDQDGARFFCSNNLGVAREGFLEAGGFDTSFERAAGEDREFCDRWQHDGGATRYAPDVVVRHAHELSRQSYWRQHLAYGRAAARYRRLYAARRGEAVKVEPFRFYRELLLWPFGKFPFPRAAVLSVLLGVSQAANALGFALDARANNG